MNVRTMCAIPTLSVAIWKDHTPVAAVKDLQEMEKLAQVMSFPSNQRTAVVTH